MLKQYDEFDCLINGRITFGGPLTSVLQL